MERPVSFQTTINWHQIEGRAAIIKKAVRAFQSRKVTQPIVAQKVQKQRLWNTKRTPGSCQKTIKTRQRPAMTGMIQSVTVSWFFLKNMGPFDPILGGWIIFLLGCQVTALKVRRERANR